MTDPIAIPAAPRQPWVPASLVDSRSRQYDRQRKTWRRWEHNPDCSGCDGYGNYGANAWATESLLHTSASCPCGGWADELDEWASATVAGLIRRRWEIFAARRAAAETAAGGSVEPVQLALDLGTVA